MSGTFSSTALPFLSSESPLPSRGKNVVEKNMVSRKINSPEEFETNKSIYTDLIQSAEKDKEDEILGRIALWKMKEDGIVHPNWKLVRCMR